MSYRDLSHLKDSDAYFSIGGVLEQGVLSAVYVIFRVSLRFQVNQIFEWAEFPSWECYKIKEHFANASWNGTFRVLGTKLVAKVKKRRSCYKERSCLNKIKLTGARNFWNPHSALPLVHIYQSAIAIATVSRFFRSKCRTQYSSMHQAQDGAPLGIYADLWIESAGNMLICSGKRWRAYHLKQVLSYFPMNRIGEICCLSALMRSIWFRGFWGPAVEATREATGGGRGYSVHRVMPTSSPNSLGNQNFQKIFTTNSFRIAWDSAFIVGELMWPTIGRIRVCWAAWLRWNPYQNMLVDVWG